jgi:hypothetical protein
MFPANITRNIPWVDFMLPIRELAGYTILETFIQFYVLIIIVKHMGCRIVNAIALYFVLPKKHCNSDMIMVSRTEIWSYI